MNPLITDLEKFADQLGSGDGLIQLGIIAAGLLLAWFAAREAKSHVAGDLPPGRLKVMAGSFHRVAFPLLAFLLIWLARVLLAKVMPVDVLKIAIPVIASFAAIRLLVYLIRHLMAPSQLLKASERIIAYTMWAVAVLYITGLLPEVEAALTDVSFTVGKQKITLLMVLTGVAMVLLTLLIAVTLSRIAEQRIMAQEAVSLSLRLALSKALQAIAVLVAILIALPMVGIDLTVLSVFGGAIGVGLGFGLQKVASNYVSGFIILLERSVRVGDMVTVDGRQGNITAINGRYTVIKSLDGTESLLPNEMFITGPVINHTYTDPRTSVKIPVSVAYDTDLDKLETLLIRLAKDTSRVIADPAPSMSVKALGDNGIEVELGVWIRDPEQGQGALRSELLRRIWRAFVTEGIKVPFPQRQLRWTDLQESSSADLKSSNQSST